MSSGLPLAGRSSTFTGAAAATSGSLVFSAAAVAASPASTAGGLSAGVAASSAAGAGAAPASPSAPLSAVSMAEEISASSSLSRGPASTAADASTGVAAALSPEPSSDSAAVSGDSVGGGSSEAVGMASLADSSGISVSAGGLDGVGPEVLPDDGPMPMIVRLAPRGTAWGRTGAMGSTGSEPDSLSISSTTGASREAVPAPGWLSRIEARFWRLPSSSLMNLIPIPAGASSPASSSRRQTTRPTPWISERSLCRRKSNLINVPTGKGFFMRMKTPPLLTSREYCSTKSLKVALLKRIVKAIGMRLSRLPSFIRLPLRPRWAENVGGPSACRTRPRSLFRHGQCELDFLVFLVIQDA